MSIKACTVFLLKIELHSGFCILPWVSSAEQAADYQIEIDGKQIRRTAQLADTLPSWQFDQNPDQLFVCLERRTQDSDDSNLDWGVFHVDIIF